jgi:hypothetical protein
MNQGRSSHGVALAIGPSAAAPCLKLLLIPFDGLVSLHAISILPCFFPLERAKSQSTNTAPVMLEGVG